MLIQYIKGIRNVVLLNSDGKSIYRTAKDGCVPCSSIVMITLFITQMYKELVEKANLNLRRNQTETAILKRNTYFVLDEFANLPKFENIEGMVTVARSRGIRFLFVLQSYSQLTAKYGRDVGDIIKTNCKVYVP